MLRTQGACLVAVLLAGLCGSPGQAAGVSDQPWPESQQGLGLDADGFDSWADAHAALPAKVVVTPPPAGTPKAIREYSGIWSGWICPHRSTDLKVAFTKVGAKAAAATVAWAETDAKRGNAAWPLKRAGDEFRRQGNDVLYKFRLRALDDVRAGLPVMDVMRILAGGSVCAGVLRKDSAK